ncbi:RagB/SusD family nutrient uptake outer membrane protein [Sphingobacterium chungjuense]|uniref:RagB/SusD family nutrient uptake outer membrane protein n=1 Tax=Sphingobacterium chungjuense TaxID=2675553 RepID=UPI001408D20D|nr:RagB/SusD family nutrient uptake outer membrane protein [Sphingobacterium chungjuense]
MNHKIIIAYTSLLSTLSACSTLEEKPEALLVSEQFYLTEVQATSAVTGTYRKLYESGQSLYNSLIQIGVEMATDDYEAGPRARNPHVRAISGLTHDASNDRMEQLWKQSYDAINASNLNIKNITAMTDNQIRPNIKNRLLLEAKFLRALHYFNLVRWFGDVPLIIDPVTSLTPAQLYVSKSSEETIYTQIQNDLLEAQDLPGYLEYNELDRGRATRGAAKSLLAKVYLTQELWQLARDKSKEVIDEEGYGLFNTFAEVFATDRKNGVEHIFSAQFQGNSGYQGNSLASRSAPADIPGINGDYADALHLEGRLYQAFESTDSRRTITFTTGKTSPVDGQYYGLAQPQFDKYYDESVIGNQDQSSKNLPIIRFAEVLLIYAEAENELSAAPSPEAISALNKVRARANATLYLGGDDGDSFRELIFEERRKELVYEYQRWFDLARRGADYYVAKLRTANKLLAAPRHIHFPTPQRELNINPNLSQHPDWINF